jgi:hypothetical protein
MGITTRFAGRYNALDFSYGGSVGVSPAAVQVGQGNTVTGSTSIQAITYYTVDQGSNVFNPFATNAAIIVGSGANAETVTPTSVGTAGPSTTGPGVNNASISITATFANLHGPNEPISSATYGLQEAINIASANGGGEVVVTPAWYAAGGTIAMIAAATVPVFTVGLVGSTGQVRIVDERGNLVYNYTKNSVTVVSAPAAATSSTVASLTTTGTWTATTIHVLFTYVTADGGETVASSDYSFTATASKAIGGTGPAAATNVVGYRVYMGTNATSACYLTPVNSSNGTPIQCGPIAAFKIGTSFSVATANVASALIPVQNTAFPVGFIPVAAGLATVVAASPFTATGSVTTGSEWLHQQLPTGYLNRAGRLLRIRLLGSWTPAGTAKLTLAVAIASVYTGTQTTVFTTTSAASSGTAIANIDADILIYTASTGATGTVEAHGHVLASTATGTPTIAAALVDSVQAVSSAVDLTLQDTLIVTISSDATITTSQCRLAVIETLQ